MVNKLYLYLYTFDQPIRNFKCPPGIELVYLYKSNTPRALTLDFSGLISLDTVLKRLSESEEGYLAVRQNQVVSYCWFSTQAVYVKEIGKYFQVRAKEIYLYDAATRIDWRGKGLYPLVLTGILGLIAARSLRKAYIFTDSLNTASQKGIIKAGFRHFQTISSINFFGQYLLWHGKTKEKDIERLIFLKTGNSEVSC